MKFFLSPTGFAMTALRPEHYSRRVENVLGAPWIVGDWADDECVIASQADYKLVLLGTVGRTERELQRWLDSAGPIPQFETIHRSVPGSYFTLVSRADGNVQVFGSLSGFRRISYTTTGGATLVSNSLRALVELLHPALREDRIPLALIAPRPPWPIGDASYWNGIENLLPTDQLRIGPDGRETTATRWSLPVTHRPLAEVAGELREALHDAVEARARVARSSLSTDLSGGMDSTALSFFAREHTEQLTTMHLGISIEMNDDAEWAAEAAQVLESRHLRVSHNNLPKWFAGWRSSEERFAAEPEASIRTEGMHQEMARQLAGAGCTIHLAGSGADELFYPDEAVLQGLRLESPTRIYRTARSMATVHRWSMWKTIGAALTSTNAQDWLLDETRKLGKESFERPAPAWDVPFSMSPWATDTATDAARQQIIDLAMGKSLVTSFATDSLAFGMITRNGQIHRALDEETRDVGVRYEAPFLDDRVVELALSVNLIDRINIERFKPGLAAAAAGVVPERFLSRRSKGDYISLIYEAFNEHRLDIKQEVGDFQLAQRGLLNADSFSNFLSRMQPSPEKFYPFEFVLAAERWLRSAERGPVASGGS